METVDEAKRKAVETLFSILVDSYRITEIRANSVSGFETVLDGILLGYGLLACCSWAS
jgi:hypothetical protein